MSPAHCTTDMHCEEPKEQGQQSSSHSTCVWRWDPDPMNREGFESKYRQWCSVAPLVASAHTLVAVQSTCTFMPSSPFSPWSPASPG